MTKEQFNSIISNLKKVQPVVTPTYTKVPLSTPTTITTTSGCGCKK